MVPEVEAPEGSGLATVALGAEGGLGFVPEVEGVGDECGLLAEVEPVELVPVVVAGDGAGAEGAAVGAVLIIVCVGPKGVVWALLSSCIGILGMCLLLR